MFGLAASGALSQAPLGRAAAVVVRPEPSPIPGAFRPSTHVARDAIRPALKSVTDRAVVDHRIHLTKSSADITARISAIKQAAAEAKARELARIRVLGYEPGTTDPREIARQMMQNKFGWGASQFDCYNNIIIRESNWQWWADNPHSSAYGIPQALPGSKMASAGADWRTNPATQIKWGLGYVKSRFGTPCSAWSFKRAHGWY